MYTFDLNSIYSVIINTIVNIYTMSCETGSDSKHIAYILVISCTSLLFLPMQNWVFSGHDSYYSDAMFCFVSIIQKPDKPLTVFFAPSY